MLRIERVGGGPFCRVPVQCSQIGQDRGALEKAAKTQARLDPHNTPTQKSSSPLTPTPGADHTPPHGLPPPPQLTVFRAQSLSHSPWPLLFVMGQLKVMGLRGIWPGKCRFYCLQKGSSYRDISINKRITHSWLVSTVTWKSPSRSGKWQLRQLYPGKRYLLHLIFSHSLPSRVWYTP